MGASYIQLLLIHLKNDKRFIIYASSQVQMATDYKLNIKNEERELDINENYKSQQRTEKIKEIHDKNKSNKEVEIEK